MNRFIVAQINNMITTAVIFEQSCKMGALKDDGKIDKEEEKVWIKGMFNSNRFLSIIKTYVLTCVITLIIISIVFILFPVVLLRPDSYFWQSVANGNLEPSSSLGEDYILILKWIYYRFMDLK